MRLRLQRKLDERVGPFWIFAVRRNGKLPRSSANNRAVAEVGGGQEEQVVADFVKSGSYEIEVVGVRYPARASLRPMYDPKGERVRS